MNKLTINAQPMRQKMHRQAGFTLIEILVVMAVVGLLSVFAVSSLPGLTRQVGLETPVQQLNQDIQGLRAQSQTSSNSWRIRVVSLSSYVVEQNTTAATWVTKKTVDLPGGMTLVNSAVGDTLTMSSQGLLVLSLTGAVPGEIHISNGERKMRLIPTLVGMVKVMK